MPAILVHAVFDTVFINPDMSAWVIDFMYFREHVGVLGFLIAQVLKILLRRVVFLRSSRDRLYNVHVPKCNIPLSSCNECHYLVGVSSPVRSPTC